MEMIECPISGMVLYEQRQPALPGVKYRTAAWEETYAVGKTVYGATRTNTVQRTQSSLPGFTSKGNV